VKFVAEFAVMLKVVDEGLVYVVCGKTRVEDLQAVKDAGGEVETDVVLITPRVVDGYGEGMGAGADRDNGDFGTLAEHGFGFSGIFGQAGKRGLADA